MYGERKGAGSSIGVVVRLLGTMACWYTKGEVIPLTPEVRKVWGREEETGTGEVAVVGTEYSELVACWGVEERELKKRMLCAPF